jgi:hypothetical protein
MDASNGNFRIGMRDGSPLYAAFRHPKTPADPSVGYGTGMAAGGIVSATLGFAPLVAAQAFRNSGAASAVPGGVHDGLFAITALFAGFNLLLGVASTVQGAHYAMGGTPQERT